MPNPLESDCAILVLTGSRGRCRLLASVGSFRARHIRTYCRQAFRPGTRTFFFVYELLLNFLFQLFDSAQFGERKGAAYGIAAMVKGLGVPSLKQMGIAPALQQAVINKKNFRHREGKIQSVP